MRVPRRRISSSLPVLLDCGDGLVGQHQGSALALQDLGLDACQEDFSRLLRVGNLSRPLKKVPGDLK